MLQIEGPHKQIIYHLGPNLDEGPLPAFFYFALTGEESLTRDPYNQPIEVLKNEQIRIFSFTLPEHGPGLDPKKAVENWTPEKLDLFLKECQACIAFLIEKKIVDRKHIATGGLSRGAFMATHLAARVPDVHLVLGFAPMTQFPSMNLVDQIPYLMHKKLRYYIGNHDLRVGTDKCFSFINDLSNYSYEQGVRSPPVELIISPSVGHKGHGTLPHTFADGANWLKEQI